jgi:hypothetical protein
MRDGAMTVFEREPLTNVLFNKILRWGAGGRFYSLSDASDGV